jgi:hypothetical protein
MKHLVEQWRAEAANLRERYGLEHLATLCETHARELEAAITALDRPVTLEEAARISGFSKASIRRHMDDGSLTNVGGPQRPRVLVSELPRKPGKPADDAAPATPSPPPGAPRRRQKNPGERPRRWAKRPPITYRPVSENG